MSKEIPADIHVENTDSGEITLAEVRFFEAKRNAFPLYESLRTAILQNCGPTEIQVKKTQISFVNRHLFGAVSFTPVRRAKSVRIHTSPSLSVFLTGLTPPGLMRPWRHIRTVLRII